MASSSGGPANVGTVNSRSFAFSKIAFYVTNLGKKPYDNELNLQELQKIIDSYGVHAETHLLRCLFLAIDFSGDPKVQQKENSQFQLKYLQRECNELTKKPHFATLISTALHSLDHKTLKAPVLFQQLLQILQLSLVQLTLFAFALLQDQAYEAAAAYFLKCNLQDVLDIYCRQARDEVSAQVPGLRDLAVEVKLEIVHFILASGDDLTGLSPSQVSTFLNALRQDYPRDRVPAILAPWLYHDIEHQTRSEPVPFTHPPPVPVESPELILRELGYGTMATLADAEAFFRRVSGGDLKPSVVARCLGMMASSHTGLPESVAFPRSSDGSSGWDKTDTVSTWSVDKFVDAVMLVNGEMDWTAVMTLLDQPGFRLCDVRGFHMILQAFERGSQGAIFPVAVLMREWKNTQGQLSVIAQALSPNSEFNFADFPLMKAAYEHLKVQPNEKEPSVMCWTVLELLSALFRLSEVGHFEAVAALFVAPSNQCPDVLLLSILQARPMHWCTMQQKLCTRLVPLFFNKHDNSTVVLNYTWNAQAPGNSVHTLMMQSMAEWYQGGDKFDQMRLSRILDVAQELKGLLMLVNSNDMPMPFVVDLAALASRRGYLKLDKWLHDRMRDQQEMFVQGCLSYIRHRTSLHGPINASAIVDRPGALPLETITTMLACIQSYSPMAPETHDQLQMLLKLFGPIPPKPRSVATAPGPGGVPRPVMPNVNQPKTPYDPMQSSMGIPPQVPLQQPPVQLPAQVALSAQQIGHHQGAVGGGAVGGGAVGGGAVGGGGAIGGGEIGSEKSMGNLPQPQYTGASQPGAGSTSSFGNAGMNPLVAQGAAPAPRPAPAPPVVSSSSAGNVSQATGDLARKQNSVPNMDTTFSLEVEEEANNNFKGLYNRAITIDTVLEMLRTYKESSDPKQKDVFQCMLRNLFEEYKFFSSYPDKELQITGLLFGGLIEHNLVTYMYLGLALRYVLESLRKPVTHKLFSFGVSCLDRFKHRLKEYPQYCGHVATIGHFKEFPTSLAEYVTCGREGKEPPTPESAFRGMSHPAAAHPGHPGGAVASAAVTPAAGPAQQSHGHAASATAASAVGRPTAAAAAGGGGGGGATAAGSSSVGGGGSAASTDPLTHHPSTASEVTSVALPGSQGPPPPTSSSGATTASTAVASVLRETRDGHGPSIANAASIDTLVTGMEGSSSEHVELPPEAVQDRILFMFNNLSPKTLDEKVEEFKTHISSDHLPWISQHLVMKRVTMEQNLHELYVSFLKDIGNPGLVELVLSETYRNIKVLLSAEKDSTGFSDRLLLRNLGHWLGLMTLARNRPILYKDLALKDLLLEAHRRGQQDLLFVVPFVGKILEACKETKVFKPPSPWLMAIIGVLVELHSIPDLKLNLKFAVEVLCKDLGITMKDVKMYALLKDLDRPIKEQLATAKERAAASGETSAVPPSARFAYSDVNSTTFQNMAQYLTISDDTPLFSSHATFKGFVRPAVTQAVNELMTPVVERSIKIAIATTEQIVRKDFALDGDEQQLRRSAHHMVRNLTAGMVMITCREPLLVSITNQLKAAINQDASMRGVHSGIDKNLVEAACNQVATDNVEVACAFIQKSAVEKVVPEMDKRIAEEIEGRQQHRLAGRRFVNEAVYSYQMDNMPSAIRLKIGGTDPNQLAVYDEFARCLPGFLPSESFNEFTQLMEKCAAEVENHVRVLHSTQNHHMPYINLLSSLASTARQIANNHDSTGALLLLQKAVDGFLEGMHQMPRDRELIGHFRDGHLAVLRALADLRAFGQQWTMKNTTRIWHEARDEIRYSVESVTVLIRSQLLIPSELDMFVAKNIDNGNYPAIVFAIQYIKTFFVDNKGENPLTESEVGHMTDALIQVANRQSTEGSMPQVVSHIRSLLTVLPAPPAMAGGGNVVDSDDGMSGSLTVPGEQVILDKPSSVASGSGLDTSDPGLHKNEDPHGMSDKVEYLLTEWVRLHHQVNYPIKDLDRMHEAYLTRLRTANMLKNDDTITRFFRISTELCVELCYRNLQGDAGQASLLSRAKCYHTMDAFVKLAIVFVRHAGDAANISGRMGLLSKILQTVAFVLLKDHDTRSTEFHQLPYHRFYSMLLLELSMSGLLMENISFAVMQTFCVVFHHIRPQRVPGFAYGWLELISHRVMLTKLLGAQNQKLDPREVPRLDRKGWPLFQQLLLDMMKFMAPFLRNAELPKPLQQLYKGLLRVLLVLLHDFPEFLCDYHFVFCDVVPPNCIQMRNLILSAFPRNMRLPDPFTPNLKVDQLADITQLPRLLTNFTAALHPPALKAGLETYLKTSSPSNFNNELVNILQQPLPDEIGMRYNVPLLNAVVLFIGTQAVSGILAKGSPVTTSTVSNCPHMTIFQHLITHLDTEGRYLFLNSVANQLRYPNCHTHYFSCVLLHLFHEASCEAVQEQITRVLLERLIVNRPHPWGLLITFIELIKNPQYSFWNHQFVHCAPEIAKLFESVARSCTQTKARPGQDLGDD
ncbi:CCR4-NOT transcription complex subunit 1-like isoform X2 [Sycon ciliatum]|uniref:CCR4-NOT transcription complex subunit 1-like isoform X2 n=1 Tax=Sycon ciliatum TaxID=27933 RepID=UPI0031F5F098